MDITLETSRPATDIEAVYRAHAPRLWRRRSRALRRGDGLREPERWIWRTAYRIAAGALKERRHTGDTVPEASYQPDDVPSSLAEALASLPPGQRAAVVLHCYADLRVRDVAEVLGTSSAAVKVSLMRARRRLRTFLEDSDG